MIRHVNVKIFPGPAQGARSEAADPSPAPETPSDTAESVLAAAPAVFHRWIRDGACEELLIDVADYRHVPSGPGVVLVGHEANYSLDNGGGRLGLLYNRKAPIESGAEENVAQALRAALAACRKLEAEPELAGRLQFGQAHELEITVNDRALAPNTDEAFAALKAAVERALAATYGPVEFGFERLGDARERLRIAVHARGGR